MLVDLLKSLEDLKAVGLTFLRVKLGREEVVLSYHGTKLSSVITLQCDDGGICWSHVVAVNEVEMAVFRCVGEDGCIGSFGDGVPTHVGHFKAWWQIETHHVAFENSKSLVFTVFESTLEEQLQPKANAKKRAVGVNEIDNGGGEVATVNFGHGVTKSPHSGQNQFFCGSNFLWVRANFCLTSDSLNSFLNASKVSHLVVDNGDHSGGLASKSVLRGKSLRSLAYRKPEETEPTKQVRGHP